MEEAAHIKAAHIKAECALREHPALGHWLRQTPSVRLVLDRAKIAAEGGLLPRQGGGRDRLQRRRRPRPGRGAAEQLGVLGGERGGRLDAQLGGEQSAEVVAAAPPPGARWPPASPS